jgi:hypothetical protein
VGLKATSSVPCSAWSRFTRFATHLADLQRSWGPSLAVDLIVLETRQVTCACLQW